MKVLRIVKVMQGDFKASYSRIVNQYFSNLKKNLFLKKEIVERLHVFFGRKSVADRSQHRCDQSLSEVLTK